MDRGGNMYVEMKRKASNGQEWRIAANRLSGLTLQKIMKE